MTKKILVYLGIMVMVGILLMMFAIFKQPKTTSQSGFTAEKCFANGGEIVNILNDKRADGLEFRRDHKAEFCSDPNAYLGDVTGLHCPCICCKKQSLTQEQAILQVKKRYTHMSDFPYEGLPPKSITTEKYQDDWYIAFVQEGSGRPVIEARCFIVKPSGDVIENGRFIPKFNETEGLNISARKCKYGE